MTTDQILLTLLEDSKKIKAALGIDKKDSDKKQKRQADSYQIRKQILKRK